MTPLLPSTFDLVTQRLPPISPRAFRDLYLGPLQQLYQFLRPEAPAPPRPKGCPQFTSKDGFLLGLGFINQ